VTEVAGCPWAPEHRLLRIGIHGKTVDQWRLAPNNLVFLLDVSGSMSPPDRLPLVQQAMRFLVNQLRGDDSVSIVVYAGAAGIVLPKTSAANKGVILAALDNLHAGGSTAGGAGVELAYKMAEENFLPNGNNRVILATDGDFNVGITKMDDLKKLIEEKRKRGLYLTCIGVGDDNLKDGVMEMLAAKGNGNYYYLDTFAEAKKVFGRELTSTLVAVADDVKVQLEFDPAAVKSYRQIGYEDRAMANADFADDTKDAGEIGSGQSVTALYELVPHGVSRGRIATLRLRYKDPGAPASQEITAAITDEGKSAFEASPDTQFAASVAEMGDAVAQLAEPRPRIVGRRRRARAGHAGRGPRRHARRAAAPRRYVEGAVRHEEDRVVIGGIEVSVLNGAGVACLSSERGAQRAGRRSSHRDDHHLRSAPCALPPI